MIDQGGVQREARRRAAHLRSALLHLQAAAPARAEGGDASGRVRMVLGPDGLPVEIRALAGWPGFGAAVEEAFAAASAQRLRTWPTDRSANGPAAGHPDETPSPDRSGRARPVEQIAEDVIVALREAVAPPPPAGRRGAGSAGAGRLVLLLSYVDGVRCSADPEWVSRQDASGLDVALASALRDARAALARSAVPAAPSWDGLLAEATADLTGEG